MLMSKSNLYLAYDSSWARFEVRSINGHGQTILSCHMTLEEAQEQAQVHAANGSIVIVYDAEAEEPVGGVHRRGEEE
tara:strand:+ start:173 stop:403 length:231 start_codon:yes stop_codon:yes gene_type:complete